MIVTGKMQLEYIYREISGISIIYIIMLLVRNAMYVNEREKLSNFTHRCK